MIPDSFLQEIKYRNDIVDVVSEYVQLKNSGSSLVGLCPFHNERTPSFHIYRNSGSFYCFGCGVGGDVITFIRRIENLDYMEALKFLAQRSGLEMPKLNFQDKNSALRQKIYEANRCAARFFHRMLYEDIGKQAINYLKCRGLTHKTIRCFGLGYSPNNRASLSLYLKKNGFTDYEIVQANLGFINENGIIVDRFRNRVMFPIIDLRGNVIAFGGRIMTDIKPKYLNTSDTLVFKKSMSLFAFNFAKNAKIDKLILAEGYMDVISLHQAGFKNTIATLGTALTFEQAKLMSRYAKEVIIAYDSDEAGRKATYRAMDILRDAGVLVKILEIEDGKDPDEFIKANGDKGYIKFQKLIEKSGNDVQYKLDKLMQNYDITKPNDKIEYLKGAVEIISNIKNELEREIYAGKISKQTDIERNILIRQINNNIKRKLRFKNKKSLKQIGSNYDKSNQSFKEATNSKSINAEEELISYIINNPDKASDVVNKISSDEFSSGFNKRLYNYVLDRLKNNKSLDLIDFSQNFSLEEMSKISKIVSQLNFKGNDSIFLKKLLNIIKSESNKEKIKKSDFTNEEDINKYMEMLKKQKK